MSYLYDRWIKQNNIKKFNIIGFGSNIRTEDPSKFKHCPIHKGSRLIKIESEPGMLQCPQCGFQYKEKELPPEEGMKGKFPKQADPKIITAKTKKKKYYDKRGNEINQNDPDIMQNVMKGDSILYYHEKRSDEDKPHRIRK